MSENSTDSEAQFDLSIHLAALDSGHTSHAVTEDFLSEGAVVDKSRTTTIQMA